MKRVQRKMHSNKTGYQILNSSWITQLGKLNSPLLVLYTFLITCYFFFPLEEHENWPFNSPGSETKTPEIISTFHNPQAHLLTNSKHHSWIQTEIFCLSQCLHTSYSVEGGIKNKVFFRILQSNFAFLTPTRTPPPVYNSISTKTTSMFYLIILSFFIVFNTSKDKLFWNCSWQVRKLPIIISHKTQLT